MFFCPALLTLEAGRARRNHSTNTVWKPFKSVCNTVAAEGPIFPPKNCCPPHSPLHLPNIHHPHLLRPLHHLHLLHHLLWMYTYIIIIIISLYKFTGSGWGLWFSSRKCRLYKLGTQENPATNIKPIWGILEKWQRTRSAFSKLCLAFFLRKTPPYLNCIVLKLRNQIC